MTGTEHPVPLHFPPSICFLLNYIWSDYRSQTRCCGCEGSRRFGLGRCSAEAPVISRQSFESHGLRWQLPTCCDMMSTFSHELVVGKKKNSVSFQFSAEVTLFDDHLVIKVPAQQVFRSIKLTSRVRDVPDQHPSLKFSILSCFGKEDDAHGRLQCCCICVKDHYSSISSICS